MIIDCTVDYECIRISFTSASSISISAHDLYDFTHPKKQLQLLFWIHFPQTFHPFSSVIFSSFSLIISSNLSLYRPLLVRPFPQFFENHLQSSILKIRQVTLGMRSKLKNLQIQNYSLSRIHQFLTCLS
jgi:hypothetical protein